MIHAADHETAARRVLIPATRIEQELAVERPAEADALLGRDAALEVHALAGPHGTWRTLRPSEEVKVVLAPDAG